MKDDQGFITVGAARLEYKLWFGAGDSDITVVLLHEGLGCVDLWRDLPTALREATGCNVFAYSRQGYGRSDPVAVPRPIGYMHHEAYRVLPAILDHLASSRVVLVGHSDGASIALLHAGHEPHPSVAGIVALAPHVFVEPCCIDAITSAARAYRDSGLRDRLQVYHSARVDGAFWGWNKVWLSRQFLDWNIESSLPSINVPVRVIQGQDDPYGTIAQVDAITSACPVADAVVLERCGHAPQRDCPVETLDAIVQSVTAL
jgi:pimeloyl-ACP methyl ester carboxylesterase